MSFAENLKKLPGISHLAAVNLLDKAETVVATIENKPGSQGSLAVYNHLAQTYGSINTEAAKKAEIFAEHTEDARSNPGKHPNIDRLIAIEQGGPALRVKHVLRCKCRLSWQHRLLGGCCDGFHDASIKNSRWISQKSRKMCDFGWD
ncbi:MAG: DUF2322 family protein [Dechloromonas sp.]|nr:MAG: DUF2322 family protein [Dechloromonas sp.]